MCNLLGNHTLSQNDFDGDYELVRPSLSRRISNPDQKKKKKNETETETETVFSVYY